MATVLRIVAPLLLSCATAAGSGGSGGSGGDAPGVGKPVPDLVVRSLSGKGDIRLSGLRGKVVLLDIWASWCAPCKEEMPLLDDMAARLKGKGVEIVAVSIDEDRAAAEDFLRSRKRWSLTLGHDPEGRVPELLQPPKMPTSYVVDSDGILRHVNAGFERGDADRLEQQLTRLAQAR